MPVKTLKYLFSSTNVDDADIIKTIYQISEKLDIFSDN